MPANARDDDATDVQESPAIDPLALLADLLARMAADPEADAEASAYAQRALERARVERDVALRSASALSAGGVGDTQPVAQAVARCVRPALASRRLRRRLTRRRTAWNDSSTRSRRRYRACRPRYAVTPARNSARRHQRLRVATGLLATAGLQLAGVAGCCAASGRQT